MKNMTPEQFVQFLAEYCSDKLSRLDYYKDMEHAAFPMGKREAYNDINGFINLYLNDRKDAA